MSDQKDLLTKEQAYGMMEEILEQKMSDHLEEVKAGNDTFVKQLANAMREEPPKAKAKASPEEIKQGMAVVCGALAQAKGNLEGAASIAKAHGNDWAAKALGTGTVAAGGAIISPQYSSEFIPLLRANNVFIKAGARVVPMDSGILHFGRMATGATAAYRGESVAATVSEQTFGEIILNAKLLSVITPASNQLLSRSPQAAAIVQEDLISAATTKMEASFIRSVGASNEPTGLLSLASNTSDETNTAGTSNGSTVGERIYDLGLMITTLKNSNIPFLRPAWLLNYRTIMALWNQLSSGGDFIFRDEMMSGKLYGIPFYDTSNIPVNLTAAAGSGAGSDASEIYLVDMAQMLVGETESLQVSVSDSASYTASGSLVSAFERGETLVRVDMEHDLADRYVGASIYVLESVTWQ